MESVKITNGQIIRIAVDQKQALSSKEIVKNVVLLNEDLFANNDPDSELGWRKLYNHFQNMVVKKYKLIIKMKKGEAKEKRMSEFLDQEYFPPTTRAGNLLPNSPRKRKMQSKLHEQSKTVKRLKAQLVETQGKVKDHEIEISICKATEEVLEKECKEFENRLEALEGVSKELEGLKQKNLNVDELNEKIAGLEEESKDKSEALREAAKKLRTGSKRISKLNEKIARRTAKEGQLKEKINSQQKEIKAHKKETGKKIKELQGEKKEVEKKFLSSKKTSKLMKRVASYHKGKKKSDMKTKIKVKEEEILQLRKRMSILQNEKKTLENVVNFLEQPVVKTFEGGRYVDSVREVYIKLLSMNVGRNKVEGVIKTVLNDLAGISVEGPFPSAALTSILSAEARTLANLQAAKELAKNKHSTLHYDETSKFGYRSGSIQVSVGDRSYAIGLFDQDSGTSERLFDSIKYCIEKTAENLQRISDKEECSKLVLNLKNTMTDRHSTNYCVDTLLEDWRKELATKSIEGFAEMPHEAQKEIFSLNKLRCNLHFLLGLADAAEKGLKDYEGVARSGPVQSSVRIIQSSESGVTRTVRTVCKAFEKHGSEQSGVMAPFAVYLKDSTVKLTSFRGNRFNVLFWNGACVYYHKDHFKEFFEIHGTPNRLLQAVSEDVSDEVNMAGCRALGIIDKLLTGPFWRLCENVENILDMNPKIKEIQENCLRWANDASSLLLNKEPAFRGADVHKDGIYECLFKSHSHEFDQLTIAALEVMLGHCCLTISRQMKDHLEGGALSDPSQKMLEETSSSPATNCISERVFASYDRLLRERPNASTLNIESTILFETNKTSAWLDGLDDDTKRFYMDMARRSAKTVIKDFKVRREKIRENMRKNLLLKKQEKDEKEKKLIERKRKIIADINELGGELTTKSEVEDRTVQMNDESAQRSALIAQLKYQKFVLGAKSDDKRCFQQSSGGRVFSVEELKKNLEQVLERNSTESTPKDCHKSIILDEDERRLQLMEVKKKIRNSLEDQRIKNITRSRKMTETNPQKQKKNEKGTVRNKEKRKIKKIKPEFLVGKLVEHIFEVDDDADLELTYTGTVTRILKKGKTAIETVYEIIYEADYDYDSDDEERDADEEDTFAYNLLEDYYGGTLRIIH